MDINGKVAVVTGGASGIGRGCAERLAEEGAIVVITDVQEDMGEETASAINRAGGQAEFLLHDVTDELQWQQVIEVIKARHGRLDILLNNAGIAIGGSIVEMPLADWQKQQAINLDGVFLGVKHSIPLMRNRTAAHAFLCRVPGLN